MKPRTKFILKIASVVVIAGLVGYYISKIRAGGERASSFVSLNYRWGLGETLQNSYDSKTGNYQYLGQRDQLHKENFKLRINNIIYLHGKIKEGDLLNVPDTIANSHSKDPNVLRFEFDFIYDDTTKHIVYYSNYDENLVVEEKVNNLQKVVAQIISETRERHLR